MAETSLTCDLCGREIENDPVRETIEGQEHNFCCAGCQRVYRQAAQSGQLDQISAKAHRDHKGRPPFQRSESAHFNIEGMYCSGCAQAAERVLQHQEGVHNAQVSFSAERGRIDYDPQKVDPQRLLESLEGLGYSARILGDKRDQSTERKHENMLLQLIVAAAFGMQVMFIYFELLYPKYASGQFSGIEIQRLHIFTWVLSTPALFIGGISILRGAWRALRARTATMDTLVALGTLSAYVYSAYMTLQGSGEVYFDSVVMITTFIMLGRFLEQIGGTQARKDLRNLLQLQPDKAMRKEGDDWLQIQSDQLNPGDIVLVKPGEHIPADGEVKRGEAMVNEAMLTGESTPLDKTPGSKVYAGTILMDNPIEMQVAEGPQATRLAQITTMVQQTLASKAPIQRLADRASGYFAAGILIVAVLTIGIWYLLDQNLASALTTGVAVLVVACPCALGLATPLAMTVTLGRTTRKGILVRKPAALEMAARIDRLVLDKTGTLTEGRMSVSRVIAASSSQQDELLRLGAAVEQYSNHPIAAAIVSSAGDEFPAASEFKQHGGLGASAVVENRNQALVRIGSANFVGAPKDGELAQAASQYQHQGQTVVWLSADGQVLGFIALRDQPKAEAQETLSRLQQLEIAPVMLSGDNPQTTEAIAGQLGMAEYEGNCPPEEKAERIRIWQKQGEKVAMVGDGINDAPALAEADLSITVAGGTDVAGETSDVILTRSDLTLLPWLIKQSHRTRRIILENLGWAFAYNMVSVPLAAFGLIKPVIAAAAMATSSLLVVGNSLRLRSRS